MPVAAVKDAQPDKYAQPDVVDVIRSLPPVLQEWIRQILTFPPEMLNLIYAWNGQVDVLLRANKGRVSHRPSVAFDRVAENSLV